MTTYRIDLHTHSKLSPDGSIDEKDYANVLQKKLLDFVAITDHNTIEYATFCQKKIGKQIIIGEEVSTQQGHLIGLFLTKQINPHKDVLETAKEIKSQGGLVYVPHSFDFLRKGIGEKHLTRILSLVDMIEVFNGRVIFHTFNTRAEKFAYNYNIIGGYGSDSHMANQLGHGAMLLKEKPSPNVQTFSNSTIEGSYNSLIGYFAPKYNRIQKYFHL